MQILYITSFIPKKNAAQAGVNVSYDLIKTIKENLDVELDVIGVVNSHQLSSDEEKELSKYVRYTKFIDISKTTKIFNVAKRLSYPLISSVRYDSRLKKIIEDLFSQRKYDYVICDYTQNSAYGEFIKKISPKTKTVLVEHDVSFLGIERKIELSNKLLKKKFLSFEYKRLKSYETKSISIFDTTITLNHKDEKLIKDYGNVKVINPYINKMEFVKQEHQGINIMFWGAMNRKENEDAVMYFMEEIWPNVNKADATFYIVGANPSNYIKNLECDNVKVTGFVEDPKTVFENIDLSVIPLRLGAGIKIKVLESLSAGLPVITTSVGAEGIIAENGKDFVVEDNAKEFSIKINELLRDKEKMKSLGENGKKFINDNYSKDYNIKILKEIFTT